MDLYTFISVFNVTNIFLSTIFYFIANIKFILKIK